MSIVTFLPKDAPRLGDYALHRRGSIGRIYQIHRSCPESQDWLDAQSERITEAEKGEYWLSMLCFPAGAIIGPASRFRKLDSPIPNFHEQRDAADYFSDCITDDTEYRDLRAAREQLRLG